MGSQMASRERTDSGQIGTWAVQDGLGIVLVRSVFRLAVWVGFFIPLGLLLGSFWVAFGLFLGHLGVSWARFGALRMACWGLMVLYSHQLIDLSSCQPAALQHLTSRPGGLREAIRRPQRSGGMNGVSDLQVSRPKSQLSKPYMSDVWPILMVLVSICLSKPKLRREVCKI